jgi:hypothetical protein
MTIMFTPKGIRASAISKTHARTSRDQKKEAGLPKVIAKRATV